jgi:hypothetical protein
MKTHAILALLSGAVFSMAAGETPAFRHVDIDTDVEIGYGVAATDVNSDGKPDIVLVDADVIVWYENPSWEKHVIVENLTRRDHVCLAATDITGDGKTEIAVGADWNPGNTVDSGTVHYLKPPEDRTQNWEPVALHTEPVIHRMRWVRVSDDDHRLVVLPLHGHLNRGGQGKGVRIWAYERVSQEYAERYGIPPWRNSKLIDNTLHMTHNLDPVQWDADVAQEILVASREGGFLFDRGEVQWLRTQLIGNEPGEDAFQGCSEIRLGKLPGGEKFIATIEPFHGNQIVTYTAPDSGDDGAFWDRQVLDDTLRQGHAVACGDFLNAGHDQLVVGWRDQNDSGKVGIKLFIPQDEEGDEWKETVVDDNQMACEDIRLADFNDDGRLDIVAAGRATHNLKVYFNEGPQ